MHPLRTSAAGVALLLLTACGGSEKTGGTTPTPPIIPNEPPPLGQAYRPSGRSASGDVAVHLFEWRWPDIARECEVWLGPKGFKAIQISPPSEHAIVRNASNFFPWWQRYQPVSYSLNSRSGTAAELADMVSRCKAVGVEIYADAVINHMTAGSGTGSAGTVYTKYSYPTVPYTSLDFNTPCNIDSYNVAAQVQNCELVGLSDLQTASDTVRGRLARYLISLNEIGIAGFRIDAAKHIPPRDLEAIISRVNAAAVAANRPRPYVFLEVIGSSNEAVTVEQYYGVGFASGGASDITEFAYGSRVSDAFLGRGSSLSALENLAGGLKPSDKSLVFVDNHDNQRGSNMYYADPQYELGIIFMLAYNFGYPALMSSFGFERSNQNGRDASPPTDANGNTRSTFDANGTSNCSVTLGSAQTTRWICEHRRPAIANMVAFRRVTAAAPVSNCGRSDWRIATDPNRIAFCRDGAGFVAISTSGFETSETLPTRLPAGSYCNIAQFDFTAASGSTPASCTGAPIVVAANGNVTVTLATRTAIAIHTGAKLN
jgi:alpha-amylase